MNGRDPRFSNNALLRYALRVARTKGEYDLALIERWLRRNTVPFDAEGLRRRRIANQRFHAAGDPVERWFGRAQSG
jgi:hypothetical protein